MFPEGRMEGCSGRSVKIDDIRWACIPATGGRLLEVTPQTARNLVNTLAQTEVVSEIASEGRTKLYSAPPLLELVLRADRPPAEQV